MPKFLEKQLKREYGAKSKVPYKVMNAIGAMRGNKETAKGRLMAKKHKADVATARRKRITVSAAGARRRARGK